MSSSGIKDPCNTLNTNQVSVGSTATKIVSANTDRRRLHLINTGTNAVFLGKDNTVLATTGYALVQNVNMANGFEYYKGDVWGITATSTSTVCYAEEAK